MGRIVDLAVKMLPRSHFGIGAHGTPAIRLQPIIPGSIEGVDPSHTYAWAIVQIRKGQPDALLVGGTADSLTGAEQQARETFRTFELRWARESGRA